MLCQVMTENVPFYQHGPGAALLKVMAGERPECPTDSAVLGVSDKLWRMVELCWHKRCTERPKICRVLDHLNMAARDLEPQLETSGLSAIDDTNLANIIPGK